jgi:uncharacterized membrane protein YhaH (DUF805 family)
VEIPLPILHDLHLLPGAAHDLRLAAALLALVLGYCAYTDVFGGRRIPNAACACVALGALALVPLIFASPGRHLFWALVACALILTVLYALPRLAVGAPAMAAGDVKLLGALALAFAQGILVLAFLTALVAVIYGLPSLARTRLAARRAGSRPARTLAPTAPAIAVAYPATLCLAGVSVADGLALLGISCAAAALSLGASRLLAEGDEAQDESNAGEKAQDLGAVVV